MLHQLALNLVVVNFLPFLFNPSFCFANLWFSYLLSGFNAFISVARVKSLSEELLY